eukprot:3197408-Amphidinium_carterae.1
MCIASSQLSGRLGHASTGLCGPLPGAGSTITARIAGTNCHQGCCRQMVEGRGLGVPSEYLSKPVFVDTSKVLVDGGSVNSSGLFSESWNHSFPSYPKVRNREEEEEEGFEQDSTPEKQRQYSPLAA